MAGNARFHDKLHRTNHHTLSTAGIPDSATDPIASPSYPFQGDFVVNGLLSSSKGLDVLSANYGGDVYCENLHVRDTTYTNFISGEGTETIISDGALTGFGANTLTLDYGKAIYSKVNNNTIMYIASSNIGIMTESPRSTVDILGNTFIQATTAVTPETGLLTLIKSSSAYNTNDLEIRTYGSWANGINSTAGGLKIRSAGGTFTTPTQTLSGRIGYIIGSSTHDGNTWKNSVAINFGLEENALIDNQPSFISFDTLSGGITEARREVMRITSEGKVGIGTSNPTGITTPFSASGRSVHLYNNTNDGTSTNSNSIVISESVNRNAYFLAAIGPSNIGGLSVNRSSDATALGRILIDYAGTTVFQNGNDGYTETMRILSGGNIGIGTSSPTEKLHVDGNLLVTGNISALGDLTQINTSIVTTSAMIIDTSGTTDALRITQRGTGNVILVEDESSDSTPFVVTSGGNVGIGTGSPYDVSGFTSLTINSPTSGGRVDFQRNGTQMGLIYSSTPTNFDVEATGAFNRIRLNTNGQNRVMINESGNVGIGITNPTEKLNVDGNVLITANLSALSTIYTVSGNSDNWNNTYSTVSSTSAILQSTYSTVSSNSANWQNTFSTVSSNSAKWESVYSTVSSNSANWQNTFSTVSGTSANWESSYSIVSSNSANWESTYSNVSSNSANWESTKSTVSSNSANWNNTYSSVSSNSANWKNTFSAVSSNSANWESTYSTVSSNSANWESTKTTVNSNSANWLSGSNTLYFTASSIHTDGLSANVLSANIIRLYQAIHVSVSAVTVAPGSTTTMTINSPSYFFVNVTGAGTANFNLPTTNGNNRGMLFYIKNLSTQANRIVSVNDSAGNQITNGSLVGGAGSYTEAVWDGATWQTISHV